MMPLIDEAIALQVAQRNKMLGKLKGLIRRATAAGMNGNLVTVNTLAGDSMGDLARLAGPLIAANDEVYLLNVTGDEKTPGWLVLGKVGGATAAPLGDAAGRDTVSYGGTTATTLAAPVVTFSGLDSARTYRVKAWLTLAVTPASGATASGALVIAGTVGTYKDASNNMLGVYGTRDVSGATSVAVQCSVKTSTATAVTWTNLRLIAEAQPL